MFGEIGCSTVGAHRQITNQVGSKFGLKNISVGLGIDWIFIGVQFPMFYSVGLIN